MTSKGALVGDLLALAREDLRHEDLRHEGHRVVPPEVGVCASHLLAVLACYIDSMCYTLMQCSIFASLHSSRRVVILMSMADFTSVSRCLKYRSTSTWTARWAR